MRTPAFTPARSRRAVAAAGALVAVAYLATVPTPLRVDTDAAYMLELGASFADGHGLDIVGVPSFPPGYPFLVGVLEKLGVATPPVLVAVALAFLAAGLGCWWVVCRIDLGLSGLEAGIVALVTALSVYAVKYAAMPLTEVPFESLCPESSAPLRKRSTSARTTGYA